MKTNLQLFGGRGGGSGLNGGGGSSASGQYGDRNSAAAQAYRDEVSSLAADYANMTRGDLQAAVEAYAMTHNGVDEDAMLNDVEAVARRNENNPTGEFTNNVYGQRNSNGYADDVKIAAENRVSHAQGQIDKLGTRSNMTVEYRDADGNRYSANVQRVSEKRNGYKQTAYRVQVDKTTYGDRERVWYQYYDTASQARNAVRDHSNIPRRKQERRR